MLYLIVRSLALILLRVYCRLEVSGFKNIPFRGGAILAANHASYLDAPALAAASPRAVSFLAKKGLFRNALFGRFIAALNAFPLKTRNGDLKALRWALGRLKTGKVIVIFPEGGRNADDNLGEPLRGVGLLAARADVPIVPAFIKGTNQAMPVGSKFVWPKKVKVFFGRPIWPQQLQQQLKTRDFYQSIALRTMEEIGRLKSSSS